jgi:4-carboxymuconolactone decarboxylase
LAILLTAARWNAAFVWQHHAPLAMEAGLSKQEVEHIRLLERPHYNNAEDLAVHDFVIELLRDGTVGEATWSCCARVLPRERMADLLGLVGYYSSVAMTTNAANLPAKYVMFGVWPEGVSVVLAD